jgi:DNA transformation protein and related proteins
MPRNQTKKLNAKTPVEELWNISTVSAQWLRDENILTYKDLSQANLFQLWLQLKMKHSQVTRLMYFALWGAKNDCHWNLISPEEKAQFEKQLARLKSTSAAPTK